MAGGWCGMCAVVQDSLYIIITWMLVFRMVWDVCNAMELCTLEKVRGERAVKGSYND